MDIICIDNEAFYKLIDHVVQHIEKKKGATQEKWISGEEAMKKLRIKSKTTLQKYRDEGKIRFSPIDRKNFLYDSDSIDELIEKHAIDTF